MNLNTFSRSSDVISFISWFNENHQSLIINFRILKTRFVPEGIYISGTGFSSALNHYRWLATGMHTGDWQETKEKLSNFRTSLRKFTKINDSECALQTCAEILKWGGDRNSNSGAYPFLHSKNKNKELTTYLEKSSETLKLEQSNLEELSGIEKMNAMLTKVHAIYSDDGLPIYDSRVAAAIATLIEMWRRASSKEKEALPPELTFPSTTRTRRVINAYPDAIYPHTISYNQSDSAILWASAKVRLGWLIKLILKDNPDLFSHESSSERMHAFEACLFMIGYNVGCLTSYDKKISSRTISNKFSTKPLKNTTTTLNGKTTIQYNIDLMSGGITGKWGKTKFNFEKELMDELLLTFPKNTSLPLGANMTGNSLNLSLGSWLHNAHAITPRWASCLAAVLVKENLAEGDKIGSRIILTFK